MKTVAQQAALEAIMASGVSVDSDTLASLLAHEYTEREKTMSAKLSQFTMVVPAAITERFAAWMQDIGTNPACVIGKPITLTLTKPDGDAYTDSTYHAQAYRAIAAAKDGEAWIARYPAVSCFSVRYIHKRTALVLTRRPAAPAAPAAPAIK